ncbi:hypothetical protein [Paenibacillus lignilyticus]|uniref:Uncharacterized protein n=1 Tax=Paenibacillus lignilyticus TaxID=1172615 RepID=A0ABS5CES7_9BACL|nr:hypothetical protein [Paenibacillus lignilyticus]MBP3964235.1 hypothetical protein [Paenibacillus lignilyticus]SFS85208.1 hypothetical protein SAMN05428962_3260 [Paenibacillus sp. BC26]
MTGTSALTYKINLLRKVELLCYQVTHYLLRSEEEAAAASEEALTALFRNPIFLEASEEERSAIARKTAITVAMQRAAGSAQTRQKELTPHAAGDM